MRERVFSLVLQWEVSGKLNTLLPAPTDECDATVFAKGGAGEAGELSESYRDLSLLSMIVDVASMKPGQASDDEHTSTTNEEHTFLFQKGSADAINAVAERTKAFLEEERRLSTACDKQAVEAKAGKGEGPLGDRGDRDFVDRLWSVLQHCSTVSTMVAVMTRVLDNLGGADG